MGTMINAVKLEKVWEAVLRTNYVTITGLEAPRDKGELAKAMELYFAKNVAAASMAQCDQCAGWSDETLDGCPFCGDNGGDPDTETATETEAATASTMVEAAPETPAASFASTMVERTSEAVLDAKLREFRETILEFGRNFARACVIAKEIKDRHWQQRTVDGKAIYRSFEDFSRKEFGRGHTQVAAMIAAAENDLLKDVEAHGLRFAKLLLKAPEEARQAIREAKKAGAKNAELEAMSSGEHEPLERGAKAPADAKELADAKQSAAITIGLKEKAFTAKTFAAGKKGEKPRLATAFSDQPRCEIECLNGVVLYVAVKQNAKGVIELRFVAARVEDDQ